MRLNGSKEAPKEVDNVLFSAKEATRGEFIKENSVEQGGEFPRRDHGTVRGAVSEGDRELSLE